MTFVNCGQLIFCGVKGMSLTPDEIDFIQNKKISGVILYDYNFSDPAQLAELINQIQSLRDEFPLFIATHHEGGRAKSFHSHFTSLPSMKMVGAKCSPKDTFEIHKAMGDELHAVGINLNFSPCCDILTNEKNKYIGDRAFGRDVDTVEKNVSAAVRGLHTAGILACAKHFPGHGNTPKDPNFELPYITANIADLEKNEMIPFIKAARARIEMIMMSHLIVDAIDPNISCSLSALAYQYLREKINYQKIIITDDLEMKAISSHRSVEDAAVMAINAGADIVLFRTMEMAKKGLNAIEEAYKLKHLKKDNIVEKIKRINEVKEKHFSQYQPIYIPDLNSKLPSKELQNIIEKLSF